MKIVRTSIFLSCLCLFFVTCKNEPAPKEWVSIFNGVDLDGWNAKISGHEFGDNWKNTFKVVDSAISVNYDSYDKFENSFGHLFYKTPFQNYKLKLKYRFLGKQMKDGEGWAKRNSGVMIHCQDPSTMELDQSFPVSIEVQLLGGLEEKQTRPTANLCTPGTHVSMDDELITAHCIDSSSKTYYGDQWVDLEIEVRNDSIITHYINGEKVLEYNHPIIGGDFNSLTEFEGKELKQGYISLQSESHPVEFKNIMLLQL